jgi:hypothetical protein
VRRIQGGTDLEAVFLATQIWPAVLLTMADTIAAMVASEKS